jgi:hypothetical protein
LQDKPYVIFIYVLIGLAISLWPQWVTEKRGTHLASHSSNLCFWKAVGLAFATIVVILITGESVASPLILSFGLIALATSMLGGRFDALAMLASFLALCVSATLPWWQRQNGSLDISNFKILAFGLVTFVFIRLLITQVQKAENRFPIIWIIVYTLLAAILSFSTGIYTNDNALLTLWHHWGAYVGPSELLLAGAKIFNDFPVQYGLGPTVLIASLCGNDCWEGMYFIAGFTTLAFSVFIAVMALALSSNRWPVRLAILALCWATCFLWTAYPPDVGSPLTTPSVSGLRFLPVIILITYLFFTQQIEHSKPGILIAHGLWALGGLWSPESMFYVTIVWWPYYLFIRRVHGDFRSRAKGFASAALRLLSLAVGLFLVFNSVFRIIYNEGPTLYGFLAYAMNPPGPMPINPHGAVWFFIFVTIIGIGTLLQLWHRTGDTLSFRRGFLVQLLCYGVFSYFLGRSHDNQLLNIMPFVLLVLLNVISTAEGRVMPMASAVLSATFIGWLCLFGWQPWNASLNEGKLLTFDPKLLRDAMSFSNPDTVSKITDAGKAIDFLRHNYGEPFTVLDTSLDLERSTSAVPWSAIHGPANFTFIPSQRRQEFLHKTATSLKRAGWLVVAKKFPADQWLVDFDAAYERTNRIEFGSYYAIRFSPISEHVDFLRLFEKGRINDNRKVATPSGKGVLILPWDSQNGVINSLTIISGFSYKYDNLLIGQNMDLSFSVGMTYSTKESACAVIKVVGIDGIAKTIFSMILPLQAPIERIKLLPISISLNQFSGQKVSIIFSVETPGSDSSSHWVAFSRPRIAKANINKFLVTKL